MANTNTANIVNITTIITKPFTFKRVIKFPFKLVKKFVV